MIPIIYKKHKEVLQNVVELSAVICKKKKKKEKIFFPLKLVTISIMPNLNILICDLKTMEPSSDSDKYEVLRIINIKILVIL